ncbi:MAG: hypothetical protein ACTSP9_04345 [Promethearchaeota archaeon]
MRKQKKVLKSIYPKKKFPSLVFIIGGIFFVYSLFYWFFFISESNISEQIIRELVLATSIASIIMFLIFIRFFLPHVIIYEDGVKVRKAYTIATIFSYLKPRFYSWGEINSINIEKFNVGKTRTDKALNIQLKNDAFNISIDWLKNHEAILKELNQRFLIYKNLHPTLQDNENTRLITIIKHDRKLYPIGRYQPFYSFREYGKFELTCNEEGNKMEPVVIDNLLPLPNRITIKDNELTVHMNNISFAKLGFMNSKNIVVKDCSIDLLRMKSCSNITFINCSITRDLKFKECQDIKFENCIIKKIVHMKSTEITLDHCYINKIKDWMSKNNQFISTSAKSLKTNVKEETFYVRNTLNQSQIKKVKFSSKKLRPAAPNILMKSLYIIGPLAIVFMYLDKIIDSVILMVLFYILLILAIIEIITEYGFKLNYKYIKRKKDKYGIN